MQGEKPSETVKLANLFDSGMLQQIVETLSWATNVSCSLISSSGEFIVQPISPAKLCTDFIQPIIGLNKCKGCDKNHILALATQGPHKYYCWTGLLTDMVAPITFENKIIGALFGGQVVEGRLEDRKFEQFGEKIGITDKKGFRNAVKELRVMSSQEVDTILRMVSSWAKYICMFAYQKRRAETDSELKIKQLEFLYNATKLMNDPVLSLSATLETIRDKSVELVGGRAGCCCLVHPETRDLSHLIKCHLHSEAHHCGIETKDGVIAAVAREGEMMYIPNTEGHAQYRPAFPWVKAKITLPLRHGYRVLGVLNIDGENINAFDAHIQLLTTLAGQAAIAVENAFLREQWSKKLRIRLRELGSLYKVAKTSSSMGIEELLDVVLDEALALLDGDWGSVQFFDGKKSVLYHVRIRPPLTILTSDAKDRVFGLDNSRRGWVFKHQRPHFCNDVKSDPLDTCGDLSNANSHIIVPVTYRNEKLGVLTIDTSRKDAFNKESVRLLSGYADVAAAAINSSQLQEQTQAREKNVSKAFFLVQRVAATSKFEDILEVIIECTCDELNAEACSIFLRDDADCLTLRATNSHLLKGLVNKASYKIGEGLTGTVAQREEAIIVSDFAKEPNFMNKYSEVAPEQATTWIGAPILKSGRSAGVIRLTNKIPAVGSSSVVFTNNDVDLLEMIAGCIAAWV